jgi:hypothetical protein
LLDETEPWFFTRKDVGVFGLDKSFY